MKDRNFKLQNSKCKSYIYRISLVVLSCFLFSSCSNDNQDLINKFEEVKARKAKPIEKTPVVKHMPKFTYPDNSKRRNPFFKFSKRASSGIKKNSPDVNAPDLRRRKQLLEKYKLKDLTMVGTLRRNGVVWGLVSAPDEIVHKVTIGSYLGRDYGRVVSINNKKIRLVETYKDNMLWKKRDINIKLDIAKKDVVEHKNIKIEEIVR